MRSSSVIQFPAPGSERLPNVSAVLYFFCRLDFARSVWNWTTVWKRFLRFKNKKHWLFRVVAHTCTFLEHYRPRHYHLSSFTSISDMRQVPEVWFTIHQWRCFLEWHDLSSGYWKLSQPPYSGQLTTIQRCWLLVKVASIGKIGHFNCSPISFFQDENALKSSQYCVNI